MRYAREGPDTRMKWATPLCDDEAAGLAGGHGRGRGSLSLEE